MADPGRILFTAFEPSGDALAASVIARLRELCPTTKIAALGGHRSEKAGAELLESTTHHAAMFLETLKHVWSHRQRLARIEAWLKNNPIDVLVPTDSPAANWSICKLVRRVQPKAKIVHLAAPQLWAWAPWRIKKLKKSTNRVLCLLPFEPSWFQKRGVSATFVGHPLFERNDRPAIATPAQATRLALLPGSRTTEIEKNWPTMLGAFRALRQSHPTLEGRVAALDERVEGIIRRIAGSPLPEGLTIVTARTSETLTWSEVVLVASGTASLEVAAHHRPMVVMYNVNRYTYYAVGQWIVTTKTFSLPNLISQWLGRGRVVPELIPHFGVEKPVISAVETLLSDPAAWSSQLAELDRIVAAFEGLHFGETAAKRLLDVVGEGPWTGD